MEQPLDKLAPPHATGVDAAHAYASLALLAIPRASEFFNLIIKPPFEKRIEEWRQAVFEAIMNHATRIDDLEKLRTNEEFVTTFAQASQIALRNHQKEKLEALRNAVVNVALLSAPDDSLQQMFLNYVDVFTEWHLRILKFFQSPWNREEVLTKYFSAASPSLILEDAFPELRERKDFYGQVWRDLFQRGLASGEHLHINTSAHGAAAKRTTKAGDEFIKFISAPVLK